MEQAVIFTRDRQTSFPHVSQMIPPEAELDTMRLCDIEADPWVFMDRLDVAFPRRTAGGGSATRSSARLDAHEFV